MLELIPEPDSTDGESKKKSDVVTAISRYQYFDKNLTSDIMTSINQSNIFDKVLMHKKYETLCSLAISLNPFSTSI
jgi:hypothetical protein